MKRNSLFQPTMIYWTEGNTVFRSDSDGSAIEEVISIDGDYGQLTDIDIDVKPGCSTWLP
ncbi:MAG: hypothetical protein VX768_18665 [Planctomycetota bacterium]|nr:hypothetical protein [Planctomycetota bacterium]